MKTIKTEQETIISWAALDNALCIYTSCPTIQRKLERLGYQLARTINFTDGTPSGWFYAAPIKAITLRDMHKLGSRKAQPSPKSALPTPFSWLKPAKRAFTRGAKDSAQKPAPDGAPGA